MNKVSYFERIVGSSLGIFYLGFLFSVVWNWLMPVVFYLPRLTFARSIVLVMLMRMGTLVISGKPTHEKDRDQYWSEQGFLFVGGLVLLCIAWVAHFFI